jgi:hypothetical protein
MFYTPVLLLVFNRPEATRQLFDVLQVVKPYHLFVAADGPRPDNAEDIRRCHEVRSILDRIDWPCETHTLFRDTNLGCGKGPAEAISWFFKQVDQGIILEDDSIPHPDFFTYCAELLEIYRDNHVVKVIGSANFQRQKLGDSSYYFSMQNGCFCSWATWKRTWNEYDYYLKRIDNQFFKKSLKYYGVSLKEYIYWIDIFNHVKKNRYKESCWDYQLMFSIWKNKGVGIVPNVNLATNIGFNNEATHTFDDKHHGANKPSESIMPLTHPSQIKVERDADQFYHNFYYQPHVFGKQRIILNLVLINKLIKSWFNVNQSWKKQLFSILEQTYLFLAFQKSQIRNWLFWRRKGSQLRAKILDYYHHLPQAEISQEERSVIFYLESHRIALLPYSFTKSYTGEKVDVLYDPDYDLHYVLFSNKKMYYKRGWSPKKIKNYHAYLLAEQDIDSPHRYLSENFTIQPEGVLVDAGAAEGIFTLMNIDTIQKAYLIEPDKLWVEALKATFSPWHHKVTIIDKFIGSEQRDEVVSIDQMFKDIQVDFLKVDVEGWERDVLTGATEFFTKNIPLKIALATYHKQNDEKEFMERLTTAGFNASYSAGYIAYHYDTEIQAPFLRRCLIRAEK